MKSSLTCLSVIMCAAHCFAQEILDMTMSVSPANPIAGEKVVCTAKPYGTYNKDYIMVWASDEIVAFSGTNVTSVSYNYGTTGIKMMSATVYTAGFPPIRRHMAFEVYEGRLSNVSPKGWETWVTGKTYRITWRTEGDVPFVQIVLEDDRYPAEGGSMGQEFIAFQVQNTNRFDYTVPPAHPDGISGGKLGGRNYRIVVKGFDTPTGRAVPATSREKFVIYGRSAKK